MQKASTPSVSPSIDFARLLYISVHILTLLTYLLSRHSPIHLTTMSYLDELYASFMQQLHAHPLMQQINAMPATKEFYSWLSPAYVATAPRPQIGHQAPSSPQLSLPCGDGRPAIVVFLRHCGCPCMDEQTSCMNAR